MDKQKQKANNNTIDIYCKKAINPPKLLNDDCVDLWVRVSTSHQSYENQIPTLEKWITDNKPYAHYWHKVVASRYDMEHVGYKDLTDRVINRKMNKLVVWKFDRLGMTTGERLKFFNLCKEHGVKLVSITEGIDTSTSMGEMIFGIMAVLSDCEMATRKERQQLAYDSKKERGEKITPGGKEGRRSIRIEGEIPKALKLMAEGYPKTHIAKLCGMSRTTLNTILDQDEYS